MLELIPIILLRKEVQSRSEDLPRPQLQTSKTLEEGSDERKGTAKERSCMHVMAMKRKAVTVAKVATLTRCPHEG